MLDGLSERERALLAEQEERKRQAEPGKGFSKTFLRRMASSLYDPTAPDPAPAVESADVEEILIFRP